MAHNSSGAGASKRSASKSGSTSSTSSTTSGAKSGSKRSSKAKATAADSGTPAIGGAIRTQVPAPTAGNSSVQFVTDEKEIQKQRSEVHAKAEETRKAGGGAEPQKFNINARE